jgi:chemotaxis protein methyltransferase CheR
MTTQIAKERALEFTDRDFNFIRSMVMEETGIALSDHKRELVYGRLAKRLRTLGMGSFADYCRHLERHADDEMMELVNAITTNLTAFFREPHHFEFMHATALPALVGQRAATRRLRVWSAGCSTGEEAYSLGITLRESLPDVDRWDVKILATDIDSNVLAKGAAGVYPEERIADVADGRARRWFRRGRGAHAGQVRVDDTLRAMVSFKSLNLMHPWPMRGPIDIIFCRNVVIYFDKPTQKVLFERYADLLADDGYLFVGHSESLFNVTDRFQLIGRTIYRKAKAVAHGGHG